MTVNILQQRSAIQPQYNASIDWSNPITLGLAFCQVLSNSKGAMGYRAGSGSIFTPYNNAVSINNQQGRAVQTSAFLYDTGTTPLTTSNYSLLAVGNTFSTATTMSAIDDDNSASSPRCFQFRINSSKAELITFDTIGNPYFATASTMSSGKLAAGFVMGATVSGNNLAIFQNGIKVTNTASGTARAPSGNFRIGGHKGGGAPWNSGGLSLIVGWTRALTDSEQRALSENPWQLFKGLPRRLLVQTTSATIISADGTVSGSSIATAQAAAIFQAAGLSAGTATLSAQISTIYQSTGSSIGSVSCDASTASIWNSSGNASASSTVTATIAAIWITSANSVGDSSTVATTGSVWQSVGSSANSSNATGNSSSIWETVGNSVGVSTSTATANTLFVVIGSASGTSIVQASTVSGTIVTADGTSIGSSSVTSLTNTLIESIGSITGVSLVQATANTIIQAEGTSVGQSDALADIHIIQVTLASSIGVSSASAITQVIKEVIGNAIGSSTAQATSEEPVPPAELEPITGSITVMLLTPQYSAKNITPSYTVSRL